MKVIYNIKKVSTSYVRGFYDFINKKGFVIGDNLEGLLGLLSYSLKKIYDLPSIDGNYYTCYHGEECVDYLKNIRGVPKNPKSVKMSDRFDIYNMSRSYFLAVYLYKEEMVRQSFQYLVEKC